MLMSALKPLGELENAAEFVARHIGIEDSDERHMLSVIGAASRRALIDAIVPRAIARPTAMALPAPLTEARALADLKRIAGKNRVLKSFIGQGYHGTITPGVILRNVLENPAWYTAYMLATTAGSTWAVQMFEVAFSRRMCCSRVCSARR